MFRSLRKLVGWFFALLLLLIVAAVIIPSFISMDVYRRELQQRLSDMSGREVSLTGEMELVLLPEIALRVSDVSIANPPGFEKTSMVEVELLSLVMALTPLLQGKIAIKELSLESPNIHLRRNIKGKNNWDFVAAKKDKRQQQTDSTADNKKKTSSLSVDIQSLDIYNGVVTWRVPGQKSTYKMKDINLSLERFEKPLMLTATAQFDDKSVTIESRLSTPDKLLAEGKADLAFKVMLADAVAAFRGKISTSPVLLTGELKANIPSINQLSEQLSGATVIPGDTLGVVKLSSQANISAQKLELSQADIYLDSSNLKGKLAIAYGGVLPFIETSLFIDKFDLNTYLPVGGYAANNNNSGTAPTHVGWNKNTFDFSALKKLNADISVNVNELAAKNLLIKKVNSILLLKKGKLAINVSHASLYDGKANARITVDTSHTVPEMSFAMRASKINLKPFLVDAVRENRLSGGVGDVDIAVSGYGRSQYETVSNLRGGATFRVVDGSIRGINLAQMMRNIKSAFADTDTASRKTDFAELSGTATIDGGIITNRDLVMKNPVIRVNGSGQADLMTHRVSYRLTPKFVASVKGQGDVKENRRGIAVPVIIGGTFNNLKFRPDIAGMINENIKNPENLKESTKDIKDDFKNIKRQFKEMDSKDKKNLIKKLLPL